MLFYESIGFFIRSCAGIKSQNNNSMMCKIQSFYLIDKVFIMGGDAARVGHAILNTCTAITNMYSWRDRNGEIANKNIAWWYLTMRSYPGLHLYLIKSTISSTFPYRSKIVIRFTFNTVKSIYLSLFISTFKLIRIEKKKKVIVLYILHFLTILNIL